MVCIRRLEGRGLWSTALPRFLLLYAAMYAAFGVASPFFPALVTARGLSAEPLGLVLGAGTAARLLTATLAGRTGDGIVKLTVDRQNPFHSAGVEAAFQAQTSHVE